MKKFFVLFTPVQIAVLLLIVQAHSMQQEQGNRMQNPDEQQQANNMLNPNLPQQQVMPQQQIVPFQNNQAAPQNNQQNQNNQVDPQNKIQKKGCCELCGETLGNCCRAIIRLCTKCNIIDWDAQHCRTCCVICPVRRDPNSNYNCLCCCNDFDESKCYICCGKARLYQKDRNEWDDVYWICGGCFLIVLGQKKSPIYEKEDPPYPCCCCTSFCKGLGKQCDRDYSVLGCILCQCVDGEAQQENQQK